MIKKFVSVKTLKSGVLLPFAINTTSVKEVSSFWPGALKMATWRMGSPYTIVPPPTVTSATEKKLWKAVVNNDFHQVFEALRSKKANTTISKTLLASSLHVACENGHLGIVAELLRHPSVDVNQRDQHLSTPLNLACRNSHPDVACLLLRDSQADISLSDDEGIAPLVTSALWDLKQVFEMATARAQTT